MANAYIKALVILAAKVVMGHTKKSVKLARTIYNLHLVNVIV